MPIIIIFILLSFNIWAFSDDVSDVNGVPTLVIKDQENILIKFVAESPLQNLKNKKWFTINKKEYLLTVWYKGAHSEVLRIFSPGEKKMVYEHKASWPVNVIYKPDRVEIITTGNSVGNEMPDQYLITWTPTEVTKKKIEE